jgi:surface antigen
MAVALDPQGSGSPVTWDNPDTGFKGTFTPVGQPFVKGRRDLPRSSWPA